MKREHERALENHITAHHRTVIELVDRLMESIKRIYSIVSVEGVFSITPARLTVNPEYGKVRMACLSMLARFDIGE